MRPIPLVRASWARPFVQFFREIGAPVEDWLSSAGITSEVIENTELPCPARPLLGSIDELIHLAGGGEGCEIGLKIGLEVGVRTGLTSLGSFGRAVTSAPTLAEAIETARRLMPSVHTARAFQLSCSGTQAQFASRVNDAQLAPTPWEDTYVLLLMIELVRMAAGPDWSPKQLCLQAGPANLRARCSAFPDVAIRHGEPVTAIQFPREFLSLPLIHGKRGRIPAKTTSFRPSHTSLREPLPTDFIGSVERTLEFLLQQGDAEIDTLAEIMEISRRTLQRRLLAMGETFSQLLERVRFGIARDRLCDPASKVIDVAFELGYSDPTHFTRAFRRWTGSAPRNFRAHMLRTETHQTAKTAV